MFCYLYVIAYIWLLCLRLVDFLLVCLHLLSDGGLIIIGVGLMFVWVLVLV